MFKKIFSLYLNKKTFFKGSAVLALTALLSNILGLFRDRLLAQNFGASTVLDAYSAAFILPNLLLNIFVAGALTAAFVPIFSSLISSDKRKEAKEFSNSVLNSSILIVLFFGLLLFIFARQLSSLIVPGFTEQSKTLFVNLMRLLLLSPLIFAISNTFGNILVGEERFFWYGISPSIYNIGIIVGALFSKKFGIQGVVIGTLVGAILHLVTRIIGVGKKYLTYRPNIKFDEHFKKYVKLMLPRMIGQPIDQLTFLGFTIMASTIGAGSIVILNIANNFQTVPVAIIGITFALIAFPILSKIAARNNKKEFMNETNFTIKAIILTTAPAALIMYMLRRPIIAILIGGGHFDTNAIYTTAATLGMFCPSIVTESINHLLARAFYALKNSHTPTIIALGGLAVSLSSAYFFSKTYGVQGLALAFLAGSVFKLIFHLIFLKNQAVKSFSEQEAITYAGE